MLAVQAARPITRGMINQNGDGRRGMSSGPVPGPDASATGRRLPRWIQAALGVPLVGKIAGANAIIVLAALVVALAASGNGNAEMRFVLLLASALAISLVVNVMLVLLALRPLADLETTAQRIWRGDLNARVPHSLLAHSDLQRVGSAQRAGAEREPAGLLGQLLGTEGGERRLLAGEGAVLHRAREQGQQHQQRADGEGGDEARAGEDAAQLALDEGAEGAGGGGVGARQRLAHGLLSERGSRQ